MKQVVLIQALGGNDFCYSGGSLVEVNESEAVSLIRDGIAREALPEDLKEIQSEKRFSLVSKGADAPKVEAVTNLDSIPPLNAPIPVEEPKPVRKRRTRNVEVQDSE